NQPRRSVRIPIGISMSRKPNPDKGVPSRWSFLTEPVTPLSKDRAAPEPAIHLQEGTCDSTIRWRSRGEPPVRPRRARRPCPRARVRGLQPVHRDVLLRGEWPRHVPAVPQPGHGGTEPRLFG